MHRKILALSVLVAIVLGCSGNEQPPGDEPATPPPAAPEPTAPPPPAATPPAPSAAPLPADLAPITSRGSRPAPAAPRPAAGAEAGPEIAAPGAVFILPAAWQRERPSSSMRLAQAQIPGAGGAGQLTVFYFGAGGGGGVEANLQRWVGQVEVDQGSQPGRDSFTTGGFRVTWVEARGTLKPSTMGTGPTEPQPGSLLLGAVVEGPAGPWYFKATGPAETLDAEREAFLDMLRSGRPQG